MKIKLDNKLLVQIAWDEILDGYRKAHEGEWISEGKYECQDIVFLEDKSGKHFMFYNSRAGSPFTDWYYSLQEEEGETECFEVELKKVTTEKWVAVKEVS